MPRDLSTLVAPVVKIAGRGLPLAWQVALSSMRIDRGLGVVGRATLRFEDPGFTLASTQDLGMGAQVEVFASEQQLFKGEVTGVMLEQSGRDAPQLVVTVDDAASKLATYRKNETFLNMSYSDIVTKLATAAGLSGSSVASTSKVHPYLLWTGTALAFLDAATARSGQVWWVDEGKLHVAKAGTSNDTVSVKLGVDLSDFSVRATGAALDKVEVTGWSEAQQAGINGKAEQTRGAESEFVAKAAGRSRGRSRGRSHNALLTEPTPLDGDEATTLAGALLVQSSSAAVVARGTCEIPNARLKPSTTVEVAEAGPANGKYLVTRVEHVYTRGGFVTRFTAGPNRPAGLVDVLGAREGQSGLSMEGVLPALVTDLADPDKVGRVKVKFATLSGELESHWARLVTLGGGEKRGLVFTPEVNDEVLVAFEQGDTRRPVVLGGLFSKKKGLANTDNVDGSKVKYRRITSKLGHVIELADGDAPADQHILLTLNGAKHKIRLGEDKFDIVVDKKPVSITNGQAKIEFAASGDITIEGNNVTIKAKQNLKLEGGLQADVKGGLGASVTGKKVEVKAELNGSVEAGGPLTVKGAMVAIN